VFHGTKVTSPKEFRDALLGVGDEVVRTVSEKMLIYALGRGLAAHDATVVRQLVRSLRQNDYKWTTLIEGIIHSDPFQMRGVGSQSAGATTAGAQ
jgi:hypothetical protein